MLQQSVERGTATAPLPDTHRVAVGPGRSLRVDRSCDDVHRPTVTTPCRNGLGLSPHRSSCPTRRVSEKRCFFPLQVTRDNEMETKGSVRTPSVPWPAVAPATLGRVSVPLPAALQACVCTHGLLVLHCVVTIACASYGSKSVASH